MTPTDPLKEALAYADKATRLRAQYSDIVLTDGLANAEVLAAAVMSRDEEIARLRLKGNHDRCNAGFRSRLKTSEEENARMRGALEEALDFIDDCGDSPLDRMTVERVEFVWDKVKAALKQEAE